MAEIFGEAREISIVKEITKMHESVMLTTLGNAVEFFKQNSPKGEYVLVVKGYEDVEEKMQDDVELIRKRLKEKLLRGFSKKEAAKMVADELNLPKNKVYKIVIESNEFK